MPKAPSPCGKNALLGVLLCGGASSRMGADKASLTLAGKPLWQHAAERLAPQLSQLIMSTSASQPSINFAPFACVVDEQAATGPLGGIHSALASPLAKAFDWFIISSCDTPLQPLDWVNHLSNASCGTPGIYYLRYQAQPHYLHALWHRSALGPLGDFVQQGGRAVRGFYAQQNAQAIDYAAAAPLSLNPFSNLNTPEDLARLQHD